MMALGAMANHPEVKVKVVPVGLSYFHAHKFRSRAVIGFGSAFDVPPDLVEMFKQGGELFQRLNNVSSEIFDSEYKPSLPNKPWLGDSGRMT